MVDFILVGFGIMVAAVLLAKMLGPDGPDLSD